MQLIVTYYNYMTDLDKKVVKLAGIIEKNKIYSFVDGGSTLTFNFSTIKALNLAKKNIQSKLPEDANVKFKIIK